MKTSQLPRKLFSIREKNPAHRRSKSSDAKSRPTSVTSEAFMSMFRSEPKQTGKDDDDKRKEAVAVEDIAKQLADMKVAGVTTDGINTALSSKYAAGDADKAVELLVLQQQAYSGIITPYNPNVPMLGAENRGAVTCYLDALLFAMFAKLEAFECMLKNGLEEEPKQRLGGLLRLWVNMLRSGKLIHTDLTERIQIALADCGWEEAKFLEQQDTSEAFAFITETLQLPLLTLQVDLFHQGKGDKDDHKVVYERLLNLAVPPDPEAKGVKLEDCLEDYFNTKVDLVRDSLEEKKSGERPILSPRSTIKLVSEEEQVEGRDAVDPTSPLQRRLTAERPEPPQESPSSSAVPNRRLSARDRSASIIQHIVVDDDGQPADADNTSLLQRAKRKGSTVVKAVTIPAWQFFRLIPWHAATDKPPQSDVEVVKQFNQRPVVGISLKRYILDNGAIKRHNTYIDIPDSLRLPHFMLLDHEEADESNGLSAEYKLVLQSVVCHRGESLHSGHYVTFARVAPKLLTENRRYDNDPPPDYEEAQWVKFDDLEANGRVSYVDDIKKSLKDEMPYLLFYQIMPMVDVTTASTEATDTEPPSYNELSVSGTAVETPSVEGSRPGVSRQTSGYFDSTTLAQTSSSTGPSIRFSADLERPSRSSLDVPDMSSSTTAIGSAYQTCASRRGSISIPEPNGTSPAVTPDANGTGEESSRLYRAAARFKNGGSGRSRPQSQAGEGRISLTMSRLGLVKPSKEPLREPDDTEGENTPTVANVPLVAIESENIEGSVKDKEHKDHHHHHHHKKDRGKSKSRSGDKDKTKAGIPDRECSVM